MVVSYPRRGRTGKADFACGEVHKPIWSDIEIRAANPSLSHWADKMSKPYEKPPPRCKAILLCERVLVETGTAKTSLVGLVDIVLLAGFPAQTDAMKLFLQLIDGIGEYEITIEVHDLGDDRIIARGKAPMIRFADRLQAINRAFSIPALPIQHAGRYDVVVLADGMEIERQQVRVKLSADGES